MRFTHGHGLLIGIGTYPKASFLNVPQTANDAAVLAAVLEDERFCGYPARQTQPLLQNDTATASAILSALDDLAKRTERADTVFLFYAGHGQQGTDGNYYLTTHDTEMRGMEVLAESGIPIGAFLEKIQTIPAERLLFLCNACYSGRVPPDLLPATTMKPFVTPPLPKDAGEALLSAGKGRVLITACGEGQESQTGSGDVTLFTQAVIEALKGYGVANHDGLISVFDLYQHVHARVKEEAQAMGKPQEPELTIIKGSGLFPVALYKGTSSPGAFESGPMPLSGPGVRSISEEQSQRSLAIYTKTVTKTKNITASGTGAVAAENIHGNAYGGGNTYNQSARGSGIAQAAGPGAQARVTHPGSSGEAGGDDGRTTAIAQLERLLDTIEESVDLSPLPRVVYITARAQVEAAIEELESTVPNTQASLDCLHAAQSATGSSEPRFAAMITEAIRTVQSL